MTAQLITNDMGEPIAIEHYYDDAPDPDEWSDRAPSSLVCEKHKCSEQECFNKARRDCDHGFIHEDDLCCGTTGCCGNCCGTDEDEYRGAWHDGCTIGSRSEIETCEGFGPAPEEEEIG